MPQNQEVAQPAAQPVRPGIYKLDASPRKLKVKMGIHGKAGVGKTRLASDIARFFKTFVMTSEFGTASIVSNPNFPEIQPNLDLKDITSWEDTKSAFEYITEHQDEYDWTIVDSLTDINKRIIDDILQNTKDEVMSMRQWGQVSARMDRLIRYMRDLRTNVLFICLTSGEKNELTGEITQYPSLTGKLKEELPAYLDIMGYMYTVESREQPGTVERHIQFTSSPRAVAKDRFDKLTYEHANMESILKKLDLID